VKSKSPEAIVPTDPADDWKDEWLYHEQEPWDNLHRLPIPKDVEIRGAQFILECEHNIHNSTRSRRVHG